MQRVQIILHPILRVDVMRVGVPGYGRALRQAQQVPALGGRRVQRARVRGVAQRARVRRVQLVQRARQRQRVREQRQHVRAARVPPDRVAGRGHARAEPASRRSTDKTYELMRLKLLIRET